LSVHRREYPYFIPGADDDSSDVGGSDGDDSGSVRWTRPGADRPWLRSALPPWHLWGNTQQVIVTAGTPTVPATVQSGQLAKVSYKRPETWHWFFAARIISADDSGGAEIQQVTINWNLTLGLGRAAQPIRVFDHFAFLWGPVAVAPGLTIYSNTTKGPLKFQLDTGPNVIDNFVAQDIQCQADIVYQSSTTVRTAIVEVSAFFAPQTHVRPDWYQDERVPEVQFGGSETGGT
jgi:hypothetical protein